MKICLLPSRVYSERYSYQNQPNKAVFERLLTQFRRIRIGLCEVKNLETRNEETELTFICQDFDIHNEFRMCTFDNNGSVNS